MNKENIKKPNLFIVGAPKCGTTALHYYLSQHPDIFMSNPKELHHFCTDLIKESDEYNKGPKYFPYRDRIKYLEVFKNVKEEKIVGESSVFYLYSKTTAKEIYKFNPEAKIIIMLREPVEFMYSFHGQLVRNTYFHEEIYDFEKALEAEKYRKQGKMFPKYVEFPSVFFYTELAKFSIQVKRYLDIFPEKQVKIIIYNDFKKDTEQIYLNVLNFLGVKPIINIDFKLINKGVRIKHPKLKILIERYGLYSIAKKILPNSTFYKLRKLIVEDKPRPPLKKDLEIELKKQFYSEVEKLSDLLNRDLITLWGYDKL